MVEESFLTESELADLERDRAWSPLSPEDQGRLDSLLQRARVGRKPRDSSRHHFIPQFLQKRFSNQIEQLAVIPVDGRSQRISNVLDIAVVSNFYTTIDKEVGENVGFEIILAELDGLASGIISELVDGDAFAVSKTDLETLALWIAVLSTRDPYTRRLFEAVADLELKKDLLENNSTEKIRERLEHNLGRTPTNDEIEGIRDISGSLDNIEITPHQNDLVVGFFDAALYCQPFVAQRSLSVIHFREPGLILSDRPVILASRSDSFGVRGLAHAEQILIPVDRKTALLLRRENSIPMSVVIAAADERMTSLNQSLLLNARAEVYCHPDDVQQLDGLKFPDVDRPLLQTDSNVGVEIDGVNLAPRRKRPRRFTHPSDTECQLDRQQRRQQVL